MHSDAARRHHLGSLDPGPPALAIPAFDVEAVGRQHAGVDLEDEEGTAAEAVDGGEGDAVAGADVVLHGPSIPFRGGTLHHVGVFVTVLAKILENILEAIVDARRTDAVRPVDPLDACPLRWQGYPGSVAVPATTPAFVRGRFVTHGLTLSFRGCGSAKRLVVGLDPLGVSLGVKVPEGRGDEVVSHREAVDLGRLRVHEVSEEASLEAFEVPALGLGRREEDSVEVGSDVFGDDLRGVHGPSIPFPL